MKKYTFLAMIAFSTLFFSGCNKNVNQPASQTQLEFISPTIKVTKQAERPSMTKTLKDFEPIEGKQVVLTTSKGDITINLFRDETPVTTANFLHLVQDKFYDGIVFHRVIDNFMAQVGDPLTKDESQKARWGTGGPGYTIVDEFSQTLKHSKAGIVSMANVGQPSTGGSQFFITLEATPWLDGKHTVFGEVTKGMDVVNKLQVGDKINSAKIVKK